MRARKPKGSVVFNKLRSTWNFLWVENGQRKSRKLGTLIELPSHVDPLRKAETVRRDMRLVAIRTPITVKQFIEQYRVERMPQRYSTRRSYECWFRKHIIPTWGSHAITDLQARPVELWLQTLDLAPKSRAELRGLLRILWEFAMWRGDVPTQRNPMELVTVKGASKRRRKPRSLTVEEFQRFIPHLDEPFRTIALICVCFGLRISECLALKWSDVDWLSSKLSVQRGIVKQHVDEVKTVGSEQQMSIHAEMVEVLKTWKQTTQFSANGAWMFASPARLGVCRGHTIKCSVRS
jgi:integrase